MTACFIFELKSEIEPKKAQQQLSKIWMRSVDGQNVDVLPDEKRGTLIRIFDYFSWDLECRERIEEILDYLFKITVDGHVYYYRFYEATYQYFKSKQKLTLDMLFGEYEPTLGGNCLRYEILRP